MWSQMFQGPRLITELAVTPRVPDPKTSTPNLHGFRSAVNPSEPCKRRQRPPIKFPDIVLASLESWLWNLLTSRVIKKGSLFICAKIDCRVAHPIICHRNMPAAWLTVLITDLCTRCLLPGWIVGRSVDLLLYIPQICHNKKWCWAWRSKQLALLRHLALGSRAPLLSGKGTPSSGSSSQDSSQPQKSTAPAYDSLLVCLVPRWVPWSSQAVVPAAFAIWRKQILWQRLSSHQKLDVLVLHFEHTHDRLALRLSRSTWGGCLRKFQWALQFQFSFTGLVCCFLRNVVHPNRFRFCWIGVLEKRLLITDK